MIEKWMIFEITKIVLDPFFPLSLWYWIRMSQYKKPACEHYMGVVSGWNWAKEEEEDGQKKEKGKLYQFSVINYFPISPQIVWYFQWRHRGRKINFLMFTSLPQVILLTHSSAFSENTFGQNWISFLGPNFWVGWRMLTGKKKVVMWKVTKW